MLSHECVESWSVAKDLYSYEENMQNVFIWTFWPQNSQRGLKHAVATMSPTDRPVFKPRERMLQYGDIQHLNSKTKLEECLITGFNVDYISIETNTKLSIDNK